MNDPIRIFSDAIEPLTIEQLTLNFGESDLVSLSSDSELKDGDTISISPFDYNTTSINLGGGLNAAQATYNFNNTNTQTFANIPTLSIQDSTTWSPITGIYGPSLNNGLTVQGNAEFAGDVKIKGKNILDLIEKIEERLAILHPNSELESEWEELKSLGEQYRKLEAHIKEKMKVWDKLKAMPKIDI